MDFIPYGKQCIDDDDIEAVVQVLKSDWLTQGPKVLEFEEAIAKRVCSKYAVAFSSGTAALHAACSAANLQAGDELITSPITFAASGNCGLYVGADIKFADICKDTYCMDPQELEKAITAKTKVIVPVDFAGHPCDMEEIHAMAQRHHCVIIEDASHALGATYKGRPVGSFADMAVYSFHPVKHIAMGEGGVVTTNNEEFYKKLKLFRTHGITNQPEDLSEKNPAPWYYEMQSLGYNYRVSDIHCALGLSQLKKLDYFLERRKIIAEKYNQAFARSTYLVVPEEVSDCQSAWHLYILRLKLEQLNKSRREIFEELRIQNIGVHVHYIPVHLQPYYKDHFGYKHGDFSVAENYYNTALTIPLFPSMDDHDVERVIKTVLKVVHDGASIGVST